MDVNPLKPTQHIPSAGKVERDRRRRKKEEEKTDKDPKDDQAEDGFGHVDTYA